MRLILSQDRRSAEIIPEDAREAKLLDKFPGLVDRKAPAKPWVLRNLLKRLGKVKADPETAAFVEKRIPFRELPKDFSFHTTPLEHQLIALRYMYTSGSGGLLLDPGLGKTKVCLDFIHLMKKRALIVCPLALCFVWEDEVAKHRPELDIYVIEDLTTTYQKAVESKKTEAAKQRHREVLETHLRRMSEADVVVVNYDKAVDSMEELLGIMNRFEIMMIDEGLVKNPSSERTKVLTKASYRIPHRWILSGTLINNSPIDVFAPVRIMEPALVGKKSTTFKDTYGVYAEYTDKVSGQKRKNLVGVRRREEIKEILHTCSLVMRKEEWLKDLPGKIFHSIWVPLPEQQMQFYRDLAENYVAKWDNGDFIEVGSPLTLLCKLQQVGNGFVYQYETIEDELVDAGLSEGKMKGPRITYTFDDQPKIRELRKLLATDLKERRLIIWYNMDMERQLIEKALEEDGVPYVTIAGGEKDTGGKVRRFNSDPTVKVLLCQARAVNYGITVLGSDKEPSDLSKFYFEPDVYTHVFYSLSYSLEVFIQQQDRSHRIGLKKTAEYYLLLAMTHTEEKIWQALSDKTELREDFLIDFTKIKRPQ